MTGEHNGRIIDNMGDWLADQSKRQAINDRRPQTRRPADLVGPGIAPLAVLIGDYNDILATYNGYYYSVVGTTNAPNSTEAFVGSVVSAPVLGGTQTFTGLTSTKIYQRVFTRGPADPSALYFGTWKVIFAGTSL